MPLQLALYAAGFDSPQIHKEADTVLNDIGFLAEVTGDFVNCFYDEAGRDIEDGRLTWLIVNAYQRANPVQKKALVKNYGTAEFNKNNMVRTELEAYGKFYNICSYVTENR